MDDQQLIRYSRHILLPEIDIEGQEKLNQSHVLIVGIGGLGSPVAKEEIKVTKKGKKKHQ